MTSEPDSTAAEASEPEDLLAEWSELSGRAQFFARRENDDRPVAWFFPVVVLYIGFFFGPWVTLFVAAASLRGRIGSRRAWAMFGIAGTAWCLLQGLSIFKGGTWTEYELQALRSTTNFLNGISMYVAVRSVAVHRYQSTVMTVLGTLILILIGTIAFVFLPSNVLIILGR